MSLGSAPVSIFGELPVPRLIVVALDRQARSDIAALRKRLSGAVPGATLDDHRLWLERLATMAKSVVFAAAVIFALVLAAMILAVAFATQGAMAGNREIIDVLHFVGAADSYISREFQRHFLQLGLRGGAIGGGAAVLAFFVLGWATPYWTATASGDQIDALFGGFALGLPGYFAIAAICIGIALLTGLISRTIVFRHLRGWGELQWRFNCNQSSLAIARLNSYQASIVICKSL